MGSETLEQWAARVAPRLTAEQWKFLAMCSWRGDWPAITSEQRVALLAYRDSVAASLGEMARWLLNDGPCTDNRRGDAEDELVAAGLLRCALPVCSHESCLLKLTDFGREVARCLEADRG